ncbi:uncharacterized protein LOC117181115 [Belonocnema kinseyi]|uniref:uncharacterized protein LOC117181115 n=1 Tax=Belonocnema kinseyi TaxID=2817044 RepID=UPI00143D869C|nr:uncharacterized protein LOC117181115 [Belonocnema kinseyi]
MGGCRGMHWKGLSPPSMSREAKKYKEFLDEYETIGHTRRILGDIKQTLLSFPPVYLPRHPVIRESRRPTPVRLVFNISSPTSSGKSLNDSLMVGSKLKKELTAVILRWRNYRFGMTADISKLFRQILMDPRDLDLQRIVCLRGPSRQLVDQLVTVTYGMTLSPFLENRVLKQLAEDEASCFPDARFILKRDFYVDDVLIWCPNLDCFSFLVNTQHVGVATK